MHTIEFKKLDLVLVRTLAQQLIQHLPAQVVIGLVGTLGAGKTTFTQAISQAAGIDPEDVTSPTFTLMCSYDASIAAGKIRLHHLDAYRIADEDEFLELGVEELFENERTWTLVEWADRVGDVLPTNTLWITIDIDGDQSNQPTRKFTLSTEDTVLAKSFPLFEIHLDS